MQDNFLTKIVNDGKEHTIITINGFQMRGMIVSFDNYAIIIKVGNRENMVYKHAISTIA